MHLRLNARSTISDTRNISNFPQLHHDIEHTFSDKSNCTSPFFKMNFAHA